MLPEGRLAVCQKGQLANPSSFEVKPSMASLASSLVLRPSCLIEPNARPVSRTDQIAASGQGSFAASWGPGRRHVSWRFL